MIPFPLVITALLALSSCSSMDNFERCAEVCAGVGTYCDGLLLDEDNHLTSICFDDGDYYDDEALREVVHKEER